MIRAILTGLGQVVCLYDRARQVSNFMQFCPNTDPFDVDAALCGRKGEERLKLFKRSVKTSAEFKQETELALGLQPLTKQEFWAAYVGMYEPNQPVIELLAKAKQRHPLVQLVAITNSDSRTLNHMVELSTLEFDLVVPSSMDVDKSQPQFFREAVEMVEARAEDCLCVDDQQKNLNAARICGMATHLYTTPALLNSCLITFGLL